MSRVQILTIGVDKVTMAEAVDRCLSWMGGDRARLVVTPNAEIAYAAAKDPELTSIINGADLVIPDGAGIVMAARILGTPVPEKVAGADLSTHVLERMSEQKRRLYLLGTRPEVVAEAARRLQERFPGIILAGYRDGYFGPEEDAAVVAGIRAAQPDYLVVGMGAPRQERWLAQHLSELGPCVAIGNGGTIDMWAGVTPRAPQWAIKANLEWLYRIVKFGRYGRSLPPLLKFGMAVVGRRLRGD
jgi:N-acetylglucosaminyldiphosphoundecaprenol N-acetyl-beta-D-mannosaminyltransferase